MIIKSYYNLSLLRTFDERFDYLVLRGIIGHPTFGFERYLNQRLYRSKKWENVRRQIILRDNGCDLGIPGYEIFDRLIVHHINPITIEDIEEENPSVFDLNNLISTSHDTHNAIHYGNEIRKPQLLKERTKGDTCPWLNIAF